MNRADAEKPTAVDAHGPPGTDGTEEAGGEETAEAETAETAYRRVGQQLALLAERLDPESFALLLKVMSGVNRALAGSDRRIDVELTPEERALLTPQLQRDVVALLETAGHSTRMEVAGTGNGGAVTDHSPHGNVTPLRPTGRPAPGR